MTEGGTGTRPLGGLSRLAPADHQRLSRDELPGLLAGRDKLIEEPREKIARLERLVSRNRELLDTAVGR